MDQKTIAFIVIAFIVGALIGYFYATTTSGQQVLARGINPTITPAQGTTCGIGGTCSKTSDCPPKSGCNVYCNPINHYCSYGNIGGGATT